MTGCSCKARRPLSGLGYLNAGAKCQDPGLRVAKVCVERGPCLKAKKKAVGVCHGYGGAGSQKAARVKAAAPTGKKSPLAKAAKACKGKKGGSFKSCVKRTIKAKK
jgi:hypothetical protein